VRAQAFVWGGVWRVTSSQADVTAAINEALLKVAVAEEQTATTKQERDKALSQASMLQTEVQRLSSDNQRLRVRTLCVTGCVVEYQPMTSVLCVMALSCMRCVRLNSQTFGVTWTTPEVNSWPLRNAQVVFRYGMEVLIVWVVVLVLWAALLLGARVSCSGSCGVCL